MSSDLKPGSLQLQQAAVGLMFEAAQKEYEAACVYGDDCRLTAARQKTHDTLDALLDAQAASYREMLGRITGQ